MRDIPLVMNKFFSNDVIDRILFAGEGGLLLEWNMSALNFYWISGQLSCSMSTRFRHRILTYCYFYFFVSDQ